MQKNVAYAQDSVALRVFDRYLDKLKEEDIKVVFVYAPIYIGLIKKMDHIEGMYSMYDSIAKKYDIPILDYNYDPLCCDTAYFYNATHLNKAGAERFSIKLAHAIDSLKLLNK
jgi:lysophospholipase L1-like esterase